MATTFIKETIINIPAGKSEYTSTALRNKIAELRTSGDIISINRVILSETQTKITTTWKDEVSYNTFKSFMTTSGEKDKLNEYALTNLIEYTTA